MNANESAILEDFGVKAQAEVGSRINVVEMVRDFSPEERLRNLASAKKRGKRRGKDPPRLKSAQSVQKRVKSTIVRVIIVIARSARRFRRTKGDC